MIPAKKGLSFSDDYFPNIEMVVESQKSNYSISPSHHHHAVALTPIGNSSSYSSSAGGHFGAHFGSDPLVPYSTGTTPPMNSLQLRPEDWPNGPNSLSASPETHHHHNAFRRSTSSNLARFAPANASPPFRKRQSPADGIPPLFATSAVTWGAITTFGSGSKAPSDTATESTADPLEPITITMHHRNQFDDEESIGVRVPLLSPRRSAFYKAYRENYADLLYTWQLQIQRLEVLKFNTTEPESGSPILGPVSSARVQAGTTNGLEIAGHCSKCGSYLDVTTGAKGECNGCKRRQATMTCVVCEVVIKGLYGPCLKCGHVAHSHCHREWFHGDEGEGGRVDRRSCPTGCGCICLGNDDIYLFGSGELTGGRRNVPTVEEPLMSADQWAVAYEGEYLW